MAKIKSSKNLLTHLRALQEIDMEYFPTQSNVFSLGMHGYFNRKESWLQATASRLASAVLSYWPFDEMELNYSVHNVKLAEQFQKLLSERIRLLKENDIKIS